MAKTMPFFGFWLQSVIDCERYSGTIALRYCLRSPP